MSIPSWVDILHLQARQKEEEGQAPDFTFTAALTSLLQEQKARASFSPDVCETSPVVSLTLFSIQPRISSATNTHGATSAASSKAYSPQSKHLWRFFSWTPPQSLGQLQVCWERPIGNKPEAWATTQPDSPGLKPEIPGEIHALDFFFCWSLWMAITNHKPPRDNVAALQQSLPMTFCSLESQHWNCYCLTTVQDLSWAFPAGDLAPWVARALGFLCNPIILCLECVYLKAIWGRSIPGHSCPNGEENLHSWGWWEPCDGLIQSTCFCWAGKHKYVILENSGY